MLDFSYYIPTRVAFGKSAMEQLPVFLEKGGWKKILIHYGGKSAVESGLLDQVVQCVKQAQVCFAKLGGVQPNPKVTLVREGIRICKEKGIDLILAVGGGSVIDSAKAIALGAKMENDIWDVLARKCSPSEALPIGCVLTHAAAGSEMAGGLVLTDEEHGLKRDFGTEKLRPVFCIENPEFTYTLSPWQTACGTVDIMMHTMERYFTPTENVDLTDELCEGLLRAVIRAGRAAIQQPRDYEARATLMWASSISQNDFMGMGRRSDWATHQLEHDLSGIYDKVSHGAGLAVLFPAWARYVIETDPRRFCRFAQQVWGISGEGLTPMEHGLKGIEATQAYFESLGMPHNLQAFGVEEERLPEMAEKCSFNGARTLGGFRVLNTQDMLNIYRNAYHQ